MSPVLGMCPWIEGKLGLQSLKISVLNYVQVKISPVFRICLSIVCGLGVWVGEGREEGGCVCMFLGGCYSSTVLFSGLLVIYVCQLGVGVCARF